jgi:hypothetical protein
MRLLYVIHQFFPDCHSGTEQHCLAVAREARRRGHEPTVLSLHWNHDRERPPIETFEAPFDGLRVIRLNHWRGLNPNDCSRGSRTVSPRPRDGTVDGPGDPRQHPTSSGDTIGGSRADSPQLRDDV